MNRTERFYRIDQMLAERRVVPLESFLEALEISRATFKRDLEYMRERNLGLGDEITIAIRTGA
ncbi:MAG TPA: DeoR family transcriptional regulator, partial [Pseudothauera hydrothermalis]|nr:DeoR family transcriptional regulator [Pseudothauera hydrothermalis]